MKFTLVAVIAAFAASVTANPSAIKRSCNILGAFHALFNVPWCISNSILPACITALAPTVKSCAKAVEDGGGDIFEDLTCLADAVGIIEHVRLLVKCTKHSSRALQAAKSNVWIWVKNRV
ncbi:hypothetical protein BD410DRAFT_804291 [Rickenella mellea]|uniref:Fungal calcium binding protein domain-containing protein n=1 Tax=Rickenella mellea TaxID=50990 RepID=A0A4Y7Q136_9AGAM|nr:hypothetical protein BD410DRAFT_804290 [Rickenella mellea]TDL21364.1 hypothetical protein BD410DRAFT_804291 [Rickenella mellea]